MGTRRATIWVATCDTPNCLALATPDLTEKGLRPSQREGRYLEIADRLDAYNAMRATGWATAANGQTWCPDHAHLAPPRPPEPEPRTTPTRVPNETTPVTDVPLPEEA